MSARGGFRRSSSLSRLSSGVGQQGAQRVSGVAFDSRVKSSGGGSGIMVHFIFLHFPRFAQFHFFSSPSLHIA